MKKLIFGSTLALSLILAGCGGGGTASTGGGASDKEEPKPAETKQETKANAEITKHMGSAWTNSIGTTWVHSAAIFENTGDTPVEIGETQMNYKGADGSMLGTSSMIYSVPDIILPGETAFIVEATVLDGVAADEYAETTFNFDNFDQTEEEPNILEVSGTKGIPTDDGYKVTGVVKNITEEQQDDIRLAAALFDENENLLGVLTGSVNVRCCTW